MPRFVARKRDRAKAYLQRPLGPVELAAVEVIAMDEFAIPKGQRYDQGDQTTGLRLPGRDRSFLKIRRASRSHHVVHRSKYGCVSTGGFSLDSLSRISISSTSTGGATMLTGS